MTSDVQMQRQKSAVTGDSQPASGAKAVAGPEVDLNLAGPAAPSGSLYRPIVNHDRLREHQALPSLAEHHLSQFRFHAPRNVEECTFWYEGTFDPLGPHHLDIILQTLELGFQRAQLALVFQNPYKPNSTPYHHRAEMARRAIEAAGYPVVDDPSKPGVCIFKDERDFHLNRLIALYDKNTYIVIGADNFENAIRKNILWVHPRSIRENPSASAHFGFRSLYDNVHGFKERILVPPVLFDIHSTDIRTGMVRPVEAVDAYAREHGLFVASDTAPKPQVPAPIQVIRSREIEPHSVRLARGALSVKIGVELARLGLWSQGVAARVHSVLAGFDLSQVHEAEKSLTNAQCGDSTSLLGHEARVVRQTCPSSLRTVRDGVMDSLVGDHLQVVGREHLEQALSAGKRILLVGNRDGWATHVLLPFGLKQVGLSALAEKMCFGFERTSKRASFFETSVGMISFGSSSSDVPMNAAVMTDALSKSARRLQKDGILAILPSPSDCKNAQIDEFAPEWTGIIQDQYLGKRGLSGEDVVIIPFAQSGSLPIADDGRIVFSEDDPPYLRFGEGIPASNLAKIVDSDGARVASHLVGLKVAQLVAPEIQGAYGTYGADIVAPPTMLGRHEELADLNRAALWLKAMAAQAPVVAPQSH